MELHEELYKRAQSHGWKMSADTAHAQAHLIGQYDLKLTIDSFLDNHGLLLDDLTGRTVGIYEVGTIDGYARSEVEKFTDVLVLVEEGMILGWTTADQVLDIGEPWFSLNVRVLHPMPKVFDFSMPCPHLAVYGGWWDMEANGWECFGCGKVVFDYKVGATGAPRVS